LVLPWFFLENISISSNPLRLSDEDCFVDRKYVLGNSSIQTPVVVVVSESRKMFFAKM
jgi:hypothetical protein